MKHDEYGDRILKGKRRRWNPTICKKTKGPHNFRLKNKSFHVELCCTECGKSEWPTDFSQFQSDLRKIRKKKGISKEKVSRLMHVDLKTVNETENYLFSNPTISTLEKYCAALGVRVRLEIEE